MTGHFTDINGVRYRVTVGTAAGTLTLGDDAVHITWERPDHLFVGLRCASCDIRVRTSVDLSSLYTDDPLGTMVTVDMLDANDEVDKCVFYGFLVPQEWEATYSGLNDDVLLTAVDALAALKGLHYMSVNGYYPQGLSAQSILARGCQLVAFDTIPTLPHNGGTINEQAFLPRYEDVSEYSGERKTWAEVLEAIAVWEGVCLMQNPEDATELMAIDIIDRVENGTADDIDVKGEDSAGADIRISIDPARSRVAVNYEDLSPMPLMPELTTRRFEGSKLSETSVVDSPKRTVARYFIAKDWASQGVRAGCGAIVNLVDTLNDANEEKVCIVGPAALRGPYYNTREPGLDFKAIVISMGVWARDDMDVDQNGYEELSVNTKKSNFDPVITVDVTHPVYGQYSISRTMLVDGKEGFQTCKINLDTLLEFDPTAHFVGNVRMSIPNHCVITDLSVEVWNKTNNNNATKIDLDRVENDGIVELRAAGWNDSVDINAKLRACSVPYSASDVADTIIVWNKFPFCKPAQFEVPRKRVQAKVNGLWPPLTVVTDEGLSTQKMVIDQADWDLRNAETDLLIEETWEEAEDE